MTPPADLWDNNTRAARWPPWFTMPTASAPSSVTGPVVYTSAYDPVGRLSSVVNPAGIAITYAYDAVGQRGR